MTELIGMCRIAETIPDVESAVVIPSLAATDLNVALAMERQHGIRPCSKATRRQGQLHNMRIGLLVHARGDHVFAPTHWGHQRGHSQQGYAQWHGDRHVMRSAAVPCARLDLWALGTRSDEGAVSVVYGGIGPRCRCRALPPIPDSARRLGMR